MRWRICGLTLALILSVSGSALSPAIAAVDPHALSLDVSAFPAGAVITRNQVDQTASAVNAEGILGGNPDKHGSLYQRLHFQGSVTERALLPRFNGAGRAVWLMATVFPSPATAVRAYADDSDFGNTCNASPSVPVSIPLQTCAYGDTTTHESGMYAVGTIGAIEFIVIGFVEIGSSAAQARAIRDTSIVVPHLIAHITSALKSGHTTSPTPHPTPTSTPVSAHSHPLPTPSSASRNQTLALTMNGHRWVLTLTRVVVAHTVHDDYNSYTARGKYILVFLTAQNLDKQPQDLNYDENFTVVDAQGRTFSLADNGGSTVVNQYNLDDTSTTVQPTFTIHTVFLFDVAKDAVGLSLHNAETDGSNARTLFNLGI